MEGEQAQDYKRIEDIVLSHPPLVQTGVDFFGKTPGSRNFNAIAFHQTGYNRLTMTQASRRAWRIGRLRFAFGFSGSHYQLVL
jgi:hypothetical protein